MSESKLSHSHRYPRVRKGMADAFYTALVTFDDVISNTEEVSQILEETVWEDPNVSITSRGSEIQKTTYYYIAKTYVIYIIFTETSGMLDI